jgi:hypothetical protein
MAFVVARDGVSVRASAKLLPVLTMIAPAPEIAPMLISAPHIAAITPDPQPIARKTRNRTALHAGGVSGAGEMVVFENLGVDADYVRELREIWPNVTTSQIVDLNTAGISPQYVRTLQTAGINLGEVAAHNVVAYKATGVTPALITALQSLGIEGLTPNDYTIAQVRGLTPEFLAIVRKHHFTNVTIRWLIAAKKADVFG